MWTFYNSPCHDTQILRELDFGDCKIDSFAKLEGFQTLKFAFTKVATIHKNWNTNSAISSL